jgi:hypothetical protein
MASVGKSLAHSWGRDEKLHPAVGDQQAAILPQQTALAAG